jgi:hypothetical protein
MKSKFSNLEHLLKERLNVIADHGLRDRDPAAHLEKLREVSAALDQEYEALRSGLPARLNHFMQSRSYQKALSFIEDGHHGGPDETAV